MLVYVVVCIEYEDIKFIGAYASYKDALKCQSELDINPIEYFEPDSAEIVIFNLIEATNGLV